MHTQVQHGRPDGLLLIIVNTVITESALAPADAQLEAGQEWCEADLMPKEGGAPHMERIHSAGCQLLALQCWCYSASRRTVSMQ